MLASHTFMIAGEIAGNRTVIAHIEEEPELMQRAIQRIADSLNQFVRAAVDAGLDGFYLSTQGAETGRFKDLSFFDRVVRPTDLAVMREAERLCPFNILHICDYHRAEFGGYDDLGIFTDYPGHVISVPVGPSELRQAAETFGRPVMGGMDRKGVLSSGPSRAVWAEARAVLDAAPKAFILGADCTVAGDTPWALLRAAVDAAHGEG